MQGDNQTNPSETVPDNKFQVLHATNNPTQTASSRPGWNEFCQQLETYATNQLAQGFRTFTAASKARQPVRSIAADLAYRLVKDSNNGLADADLQKILYAIATATPTGTFFREGKLSKILRSQAGDIGQSGPTQNQAIAPLLAELTGSDPTSIYLKNLLQQLAKLKLEDTHFQSVMTTLKQIIVDHQNLATPQNALLAKIPAAQRRYVKVDSKIPFHWPPTTPGQTDNQNELIERVENFLNAFNANVSAYYQSTKTKNINELSDLKKIILDLIDQAKNLALEGNTFRDQRPDVFNKLNSAWKTQLPSLLDRINQKMTDAHDKEIAQRQLNRASTELLAKLTALEKAQDQGHEVMVAQTAALQKRIQEVKDLEIYRQAETLGIATYLIPEDLPAKIQTAAEDKTDSQKAEVWQTLALTEGAAFELHIAEKEKTRAYRDSITLSPIDTSNLSIQQLEEKTQTLRNMNTQITVLMHHYEQARAQASLPKEQIALEQRLAGLQPHLPDMVKARTWTHNVVAQVTQFVKETRVALTTKQPTNSALRDSEESVQEAKSIFEAGDHQASANLLDALKNGANNIGQTIGNWKQALQAGYAKFRQAASEPIASTQTVSQIAPARGVVVPHQLSFGGLRELPLHVQGGSVNLHKVAPVATDPPDLAEQMVEQMKKLKQALATPKTAIDHTATMGILASAPDIIAKLPATLSQRTASRTAGLSVALSPQIRDADYEKAINQLKAVNWFQLSIEQLSAIIPALATVSQKLEGRSDTEAAEFTRFYQNFKEKVAPTLLRDIALNQGIDGYEKAIKSLVAAIGNTTRSATVAQALIVHFKKQDYRLFQSRDTSFRLSHPFTGDRPTQEDHLFGLKYEFFKGYQAYRSYEPDLIATAQLAVTKAHNKSQLEPQILALADGVVAYNARLLEMEFDLLATDRKMGYIQAWMARQQLIQQLVKIITPHLETLDETQKNSLVQLLQNSVYGFTKNAAGMIQPVTLTCDKLASYIHTDDAIQKRIANQAYFKASIAKSEESLISDWLQDDTRKKEFIQAFKNLMVIGPNSFRQVRDVLYFNGQEVTPENVNQYAVDMLKSVFYDGQLLSKKRGVTTNDAPRKTITSFIETLKTKQCLPPSFFTKWESYLETYPKAYDKTSKKAAPFHFENPVTVTSWPEKDDLLLTPRLQEKQALAEPTPKKVDSPTFDTSGMLVFATSTASTWTAEHIDHLISAVWREKAEKVDTSLKDYPIYTLIDQPTKSNHIQVLPTLDFACLNLNHIERIRQYLTPEKEVSNELICLPILHERNLHFAYLKKVNDGLHDWTLETLTCTNPGTDVAALKDSLSRILGTGINDQAITPTIVPIASDPIAHMVASADRSPDPALLSTAQSAQKQQYLDALIQRSVAGNHLICTSHEAKASIEPEGSIAQQGLLQVLHFSSHALQDLKETLKPEGEPPLTALAQIRWFRESFHTLIANVARNSRDELIQGNIQQIWTEAKNENSGVLWQIQQLHGLLEQAKEGLSTEEKIAFAQLAKTKDAAPEETALLQTQFLLAKLVLIAHTDFTALVGESTQVTTENFRHIAEGLVNQVDQVEATRAFLSAMEMKAQTAPEGSKTDDRPENASIKIQDLEKQLLSYNASLINLKYDSDDGQPATKTHLERVIAMLRELESKQGVVTAEQLSKVDLFAKVCLYFEKSQAHTYFAKAFTPERKVDNKATVNPLGKALHDFWQDLHLDPALKTLVEQAEQRFSLTQGVYHPLSADALALIRQKYPHEYRPGTDSKEPTFGIKIQDPRTSTAKITAWQSLLTNERLAEGIKNLQQRIIDSPASGKVLGITSKNLEYALELSSRAKEGKITEAELIAMAGWHYPNDIKLQSSELLVAAYSASTQIMLNKTFLAFMATDQFSEYVNNLNLGQLNQLSVVFNQISGSLKEKPLQQIKQHTLGSGIEALANSTERQRLGTLLWHFQCLCKQPVYKQALQASSLKNYFTHENKQLVINTQAADFPEWLRGNEPRQQLDQLQFLAGKLDPKQPHDTVVQQLFLTLFNEAEQAKLLQLTQIVQQVYDEIVTKKTQTGLGREAAQAFAENRIYRLYPELEITAFSSGDLQGMLVGKSKDGGMLTMEKAVNRAAVCLALAESDFERPKTLAAYYSGNRLDQPKKNILTGIFQAESTQTQEGEHKKVFTALQGTIQEKRQALLAESNITPFVKIPQASEIVVPTEVLADATYRKAIKLSGITVSGPKDKDKATPRAIFKSKITRLTLFKSGDYLEGHAEATDRPSYYKAIDVHQALPAPTRFLMDLCNQIGPEQLAQYRGLDKLFNVIKLENKKILLQPDHSEWGPGATLKLKLITREELGTILTAMFQKAQEQDPKVYQTLIEAYYRLKQDENYKNEYLSLTEKMYSLPDTSKITFRTTAGEPITTICNDRDWLMKTVPTLIKKPSSNEHVNQGSNQTADKGQFNMATVIMGNHTRKEPEPEPGATPGLGRG